MLDHIDAQALAKRIPTPFYVYSASAIRRRIAALTASLRGLDATICFAVKANSNLAILRLMADAGLGADIVSAGELRRSLRAGIPAKRIVFSGVGKTEDEIAEALNTGVWKFNVESADELHALQRLAGERQVIAHAAVRINPDVEAGGHEKISTGKAENKFGVNIDEARRWFASAADLSYVRLDGLHLHIGSQILTLDAYRAAFARVASFWRELADGGHRIDTIDVGGGLGVCYREHDRPIQIDDYTDAIRDAFAGFKGRFILEPGRFLIGESGVLVSRVIRAKEGGQRRFLILDAAMNDLMRPALYGAWHEITPLHAEPRPKVRYDVVGPVCESGDTFAVDRELPMCNGGDLVLIKGAGAYAASMASTYNSRPLLAEVLVDGHRYGIIRRRQTYEELLAAEQEAPEWQSI